MPILTSMRRSVATSAVTLGQRALNFDGALRRLQRAVELDQKSVADRFDLSAVKPRKDLSKQLPMFLQQFLGKLFIALRKRAVAHHVGKHDGGELALLSFGAHSSRPIFFNRAWKRGSFRTLS